MNKYFTIQLALSTLALSDLSGTGSTTTGATCKECHFHTWPKLQFLPSTTRPVLPSPTGSKGFGQNISKKPKEAFHWQQMGLGLKVQPNTQRTSFSV